VSVCRERSRKDYTKRKREVYSPMTKIETETVLEIYILTHASSHKRRYGARDEKKRYPCVQRQATLRSEFVGQKRHILSCVRRPFQSPSDPQHATLARCGVRGQPWARKVGEVVGMEAGGGDGGRVQGGVVSHVRFCKLNAQWRKGRRRSLPGDDGAPFPGKGAGGY